jgi:TonB family protein
MRRIPNREELVVRKSILSGLSLLLLGAGCADSQVETPPRQISASSFHYPEALWDAGVEGETILEIHVSEAGAVDSARVERSSGFAEFDSAAVAGARVLQFEPARRGDDSIAVRVLLPVQFQLPSSDPAGAIPDTATSAAPANTP